MALGELARWPRNPKAHDIPGIKASLRRFGFVDPIALDETTQRIVAGHGRLEALQEMKADGEKPPARIKVSQHPDGGEWYAPVLRGADFADEGEAEAYLIADNALTMLAGWDDAELAEMLQDQVTLEGTGYDPASLEALVAGLGVGPSDADFDGERPDDTQKPFKVVKFVVLAVGPYRVQIPKAAYDSWIDTVRLAVGFEKEKIGEEIARRLGL